jgi:hypothetical protein
MFGNKIFVKMIVFETVWNGGKKVDGEQKRFCLKVIAYIYIHIYLQVSNIVFIRIDNLS